MTRESTGLSLVSELPGQPVLAAGPIAVVIANRGTATSPAWHVRHVAARVGDSWRELLAGATEPVFVTSAGTADARECAVRATSGGGWEIEFRGGTEAWAAREVLTIEANAPVIRRHQTYVFQRAARAALRPGLRLAADPALRYTCPLHAHEQPLAAVAAQRPAEDWALPFPFHQWHDGALVAIYGVDRTASAGTVELVPETGGAARLGVYFPDTAVQPAGGVPAARPQERDFGAGESATLEAVIAVHALQAGEEPWLEAQRLAAGLLLRGPRHAFDPDRATARIAASYQHCALWEPDALGPGRGWFSNMWVRTQTGPARKRGEMSGYFDLGWGEGIAVETWMGGVRHWRRTGDAGLLPYIDTMTRSLDCFRREPGPAAAYYDRFDGQKYGDFLMNIVPGDRVWTHSLGHTGSQLIQMYQLAPDYPHAATRDAWREAALTMGRFLAEQQRPDGDLPDIFDERNREANHKPHRITARAVVCGLWTRLGTVTGEASWTGRARRLAAAVAPSIDRYEYHNQMIDGIAAPDREFVDGEAACYVLEGLVPLYLATRDPAVLALARKAAAFAFAWTYFYDLPKAQRGVARGGQCCRMDDYPLLYPIGPAKAMEPVLALAAATRDPLFDRMADEMAAFLGNWLIDAPGEPWDGAMVHAMGQFSGQHWGPDLAGQIDTGMATGNSLAALECWIEARRVRPVN